MKILFRQAGGLTSILNFYDWSLFSVVYTDGGTAGDIAKYLIRETKESGLQTAVMEPVPMKVLF